MTCVTAPCRLALDKLDEPTMELLQAFGNEFANSLWESSAAAADKKPGPRSTRDEIT